jgi:26S proteasome regulatory subunit T1
MMTELLKNAFRATVEHHHKTHGQDSHQPIPPVVVTISPSPQMPSDGRPFGAPYLSIRIRDQGGGVSAANMARIFSYSFTTAGSRVGGEGGEDDAGSGPYAAQHIGGGAALDSGSTGAGTLFADITSKGLQTGLGTIAGLGYGLPMSRLYAK